MTILEDAPVLDEVEEHDPEKHSHIVRDKAKVTEAYVFGTPVEAMCGHIFVPSKDPKNLPVCSKCKEEWEASSGRTWGT